MDQNPKKRLINVFHGKIVDITPCLPVIQTGTVELMDITGSAWPESHSNPETLKKIALKGIYTNYKN